jgi:hypothetical protein
MAKRASKSSLRGMDHIFELLERVNGCDEGGIVIKEALLGTFWDDVETRPIPRRGSASSVYSANRISADTRTSSMAFKMFSSFRYDLDLAERIFQTSTRLASSDFG